jgi:membrane peptidoglycan carboxypeptidase
MPSTLTIIRQRRDRRNRRRQSTSQRSGHVVLVVGFIVSALIVLGLMAVALGYANVTRDLPSIQQLPILLNPTNGLLLQPTRLYDRSGAHLLAVLAPTDSARTYIPFDHLPKSLINATIAAADPDFDHHAGYVWSGWNDATVHPTLAQRLAADLLLWNEPVSARRALRERLLASQMTAELGREKILEWYLNSADYGNDAYGAEAASQLYFGKPVEQISLNEAALLAAVSQSPALNPFDAPNAAEQLRLEVLQKMFAQGLISEELATQAALNKPSPTSPPTPSRNTAVGLLKGEGSNAFVNIALDQLSQKFGSNRIRRGGLTIRTTLDYELQMQAECAVKNYLARLNGQTEAIPAADGSSCEAARLLPNPPSVASFPGASASVIVTDPANGQILSVVGDVRDDQSGAYLQSHPAGTLLSPFIYLTGFTRGLSPASLGWDIPGSLANFDGQYRGPVRLRTALVNDYLPPAGDIVTQMGSASVGRVAAPFGLNIPSGTRLLQDDLSLLPLDAAAAYGVFANRGTLAGQVLSGEALHTVAVLKVIGVDGAVWTDWTTPAVQAVVSPQLAYLMNNVLSDNTARWPTLGQSNPLTIDRPASAKVSRALDLSAAWTVGYTPQRAVIVWIGNPDAATGTVPALLAADLWHAIVKYAVSNLPSENWDVPSGVTTVSVCDPSGLLPTDACPNIVNEVFLSGNEPVQADTLYQNFEIDRETGLLATVFTPPELVESHAYMVIPLEAQMWAETANIAVPPTEYDAVQTPPFQPDAHITSPLLFAQVSGTVQIRGTASGANFASYRLEFGQGLNSQAWTQIGDDSTLPVNEDVLGSWDTTGLSGLYALRLLVVRSDRRVEQAVVVVMVGEK